MIENKNQSKEASPHQHDIYEDMLNLPHHVSKTHPQMSLHDRAAQFSPFAALTGFEEKIDLASTDENNFFP